MPAEAYDHLVAIVVLGAIFMAAVVIVPNLTFVNMQYLDQQQLRNTALTALNTMLFDEGYPANWGSMSGTNEFNENEVKRFGLSALNDPSFYVLDPDKVHRLANNPTGNISYQKTKQLLGLSGYDFNLVIRPLFEVDRTVSIQRPDDRTATINFNVNVTRYDGQPVPNAVVSAHIIYATDTPSTNIAQVTTTTDSLGRCQGNQNVNITGSKITDVIVIFKVTVGDRTTMIVSAQDTVNPNNIAKINIVGDNIILTNPDDMAGPHAARWVLNILMYNFETMTNMLNGSRSNEFKLTYGQGFGVWDRQFPGLSTTEPSILIFTFDAVDGGRTIVLLVGPYATWRPSGIIEFNPASTSGGDTVSVQRDVLIAGMAYTTELKLWKT